MFMCILPARSDAFVMTINHIQNVLAVLREGSITAAAKKLFISQPALSQAIKQIEQELGTPIFDRSSTPISLTAAGQKYVEAAQQIIDIDRNLRAQIAEINEQVYGHIRVGISVQRGLQLLPQVIPAFSRLYPHVRIELVEHGSASLERMTEEGVCDLSLVTTMEKPGNLRYALIESEQIVLMVSRSAGLAQRFAPGDPIDIREAAYERFVSMATGHSVRAVQDRLFEIHGMSPSILIETKNMEAAKYVAAHSGAVMLIPQVYVTNSPDLCTLVQCHPILNNDYQRHFYLCYRKGLYLPRYMKDFIRIVCQSLGVPFCLPESTE